jgi:hypothetical protein
MCLDTIVRTVRNIAADSQQISFVLYSADNRYSKSAILANPESNSEYRDIRLIYDTADEQLIKDLRNYLIQNLQSDPELSKRSIIIKNETFADKVSYFFLVVWCERG